MAGSDSEQSRFKLRRLAVLALFLAGVAGALKVLWPEQPTHLELARQAVTDNALNAADDAYRAHLRENPGDAAVRVEFAEMLKAVNAEVAFQQFQLIPADADQYTSAQRHIAHISLLAGNDAVAQTALEHVVSEAPDDFAAVLSLAELYFRTGQFDRALPVARRAVTLQPDRARSHVLLAEVLDGLNRPGEMLAPLENAEQLEPDDYDTRALLGYALHFAGRLDDAERYVRWCLDRRPEDPTMWQTLASVSQDQGERDLAMTQIERALELEPNNLRSQLLKADLLLFDRQAESAWELLEPLHVRHLKDREFLAALTRAATMSGRPDDARRLQEEMRQLLEELSTEPVSGEGDARPTNPQPSSN